MVQPSGEGDRRQPPVAEVKPDNWSGGHSKDDMVTLTKSQLEQILEAIKGQANTLSLSEKIPCVCDKPQPASESGADAASLGEEAPCPLEPPSPSKSGLSKIEQKRMQWEKERAEMLDWNPWGKPGAGAPAKRTQRVTPLLPRAVPLVAGEARGEPCAESLRPVPPVFRSSIAFGTNNSEGYVEDKRQSWLKEFGEWYAPALASPSKHRMVLHELQRVPADPPALLDPCSCKDDTESIALSIDSHFVPAIDLARRNYTRGRGFQLDPVAAAEAERRRQQALQFQEEIRLQMAEKQRRMQEEKERKQREEEEEERRLEAERARLQQEFEQEQRRLRQKTEMEEKKHQAVLSAMQQAQAQAELDRKSKKTQKLLPNRGAEEEEEDVAAPADAPPDDPGAMRQEAEELEEEGEGEKVPRRELGVQTVAVSGAEYVVDRVLTPSVFRVRARHGRDFGTQTDDVSADSSGGEVVRRRPVRVQHAKAPCRPQWGVNQPSKSYVRMTERDPYFLRRRRGVCARTLSSSDCTLASSSEFEARSCRPFRSSSTPRFHQAGRRESRSSDNLPSILGGSEPCGAGSLPPMRRRWHSQEAFYRAPPVPPAGLLRYALASSRAPPRRKWSDQESFDLESVVRSKAEEEEEGKGNSSSASSSSSREKSSPSPNPLMCPEVVTGRPTPRQDRILQNLSSLRQGLLKKQKELESLIRRPPAYLS